MFGVLSTILDEDMTSQVRNKGLAQQIISERSKNVEKGCNVQSKGLHDFNDRVMEKRNLLQKRDRNSVMPLIVTGDEKWNYFQNSR